MNNNKLIKNILFIVLTLAVVLAWGGEPKSKKEDDPTTITRTFYSTEVEKTFKIAFKSAEISGEGGPIFTENDLTSATTTTIPKGETLTVVYTLMEGTQKIKMSDIGEEGTGSGKRYIWSLSLDPKIGAGQVTGRAKGFNRRRNNVCY